MQQQTANSVLKPSVHSADVSLRSTAPQAPGTVQLHYFPEILNLGSVDGIE